MLVRLAMLKFQWTMVRVFELELNSRMVLGSDSALALVLVLEFALSSVIKRNLMGMMN